jgi:hypothetical protein
MLTQCSQCKKTYNLSIEELRSQSTTLFCPTCEEMLGRLKVFHSGFFFDDKKNTPINSLLWSLGCLAGLLLFLVQVYWIERDKLSQNPEQRVWLEKICRSLPCHLPAYKNLDEFEVLHSNFQLQDNHYLFQIILSNQADFKQPYPHLKLSLLDFNNHAFAERVFYPSEYLSTPSTELMAVSDVIEVNLKLALPTQTVGGYTFELI